VPSIGRVRIRQSQATELPTKSATFKRTAVGRWFVTVVVKFAMPAAKAPIREEQAVGYDMVLEPPNFLAAPTARRCCWFSVKWRVGVPC